MKNQKAGYVFFLFLLIGLGLINYPLISEWVNSSHQADVLEGYKVSVSDNAAVEESLRMAEAYNRKLAENNLPLSDAFSVSEEESAEYAEQLSLDPSGIMGRIEIPAIEVSLPIYHGTGASALRNGAGHLEGSSLPIGGTGTHSVISAHTGLPGSVLFSDLDQLEIGDHFRLEVYGLQLEYEIDDIRVVTPDDTSFLEIDPERDYVTLVTCTPYGVNSHRLFVSGHRTEWTGDGADTETVSERRFGIRQVLVIAGGVSLTVLAVSVKMLFFSRRRNSDVE